MPIKRQMIIFRIGREEFAIDIALTKEIVTMRPITPIPETEDYVLGVMNLRGNLVPVLDLRKRLRAGAESAARDEARAARLCANPSAAGAEIGSSCSGRAGVH